MTWDPAQYLKFSNQRTRPALELLARVELAAPARVYDLGCGTGHLTRILAERWPGAKVVGVDSSDAMLKQGAARPSDGGARVELELADLATWAPDAGADLVYSNAALHWLPDHASILARWMRALRPGGVLAVQVPNNFDAPSHALIAETVRGGPWRDRLETLLRRPVATPQDYYRWLGPYADAVDVWETEYLQVLRGPDPVKEWTQGTWLTQFLAKLAPEEQPLFEADYAARLRVAYPPEPGGETLFPFRRLFFIAQRRAD